MHDVRALDLMIPEPDAIYVMDRAYLDFDRLSLLDQAGAFFVTRGKSNLQVKRRYSHTVDRSTGLICDQTVVLAGDIQISSGATVCTQDGLPGSGIAVVVPERHFHRRNGYYFVVHTRW